MPSSRGCHSSYDCIVKIKGVTTRPILFSRLMRSDGEGAMNPEELFADDCTPASEQKRVHEDEGVQRCRMSVLRQEADTGGLR